MRRTLLFLLFFGSAIGGALIGAPSVNAQSAFDNTVQPTSTWGGNCDFSDVFSQLVTLSPSSGGNGSGTSQLAGCDLWYAKASGSTAPWSNSFEWSEFRDSWSSADSWFLQSRSDNNYHTFTFSNSQMYLFYDELSTNNTAVLMDTFCSVDDPCWSVILSYDSLPSGYDVVISVTKSVVNLPSSPNLYGTELMFAWQTSELQFPALIQPFLIDGNYSVDYPPLYDGEDISDLEPLPPVDYTDWTPDWYISFGFDYEVTIHDTNFNTFDDNPFLCNSGLAPVVHWTIKDDSNNVLFSGTQSPTMQIVRKLPVSNSSENYSISGIYNCGDDDLQFDQYGVLNFTLTDTGLLQQAQLSDCFQGDLPFTFDIDACLGFFSPIFNLLSFGQIKLGESWNYGNTGCGYLTVLGGWVGLPNGTQICPQFSDTVRNVVTPFLSVILGLISLGFLSRLDNNRGGI